MCTFNITKKDVKKSTREKIISQSSTCQEKNQFVKHGIEPLVADGKGSSQISSVREFEISLGRRTKCYKIEVKVTCL